MYMFEDNYWYKVMDNSNLNTEIFEIGKIFKVLNCNEYFATVYSPKTNMKYFIRLDSIVKVRTIKIDSKVAELLYAKI